jgi:hypothetical protein
MGPPQKLSLPPPITAKKGRAKARTAALDLSSEPLPETVVPVVEKPKRVLSEETKLKLKAARERKKQERLDAELQRQKEAETQAAEAAAAAALAQAKKEAANAKRREARKRKLAAQGQTLTQGNDAGSVTSATGATPTPEPEPEPEPAQKKPRVRKAKSTTPSVNGTTSVGSAPSASSETDSSHPPAWFNKFVGAMLQEKHEMSGTHIAPRALKEQADQQATERWSNSYTRDRVRSTVDDHVGRMYDMIFG